MIMVRSRKSSRIRCTYMVRVDKKLNLCGRGIQILAIEQMKCIAHRGAELPRIDVKMSKQDEESVPIVADRDSSEERVATPCEVEEADNSSTESSPLVINGDGRGRCLRVARSVARVLLANLLLVLTIGSVVVGVIIGLPSREARYTLSDESYSLMVQLLGFPGEIFIRMLQMVILPLIIFSLIAGLGSLEAKVAGSLGWKTVLYYFSTTVMAIILGIILVVTIKPGGRGQQFECNNATSSSHGDLDTLDSILDLFRCA